MQYAKKDATNEEIRDALTKANALFAYDLDKDL